MSVAATPAGVSPAHSAREGSWLGRWWALLALVALGAALRLSTLDLQSFWFDEAFTPVHVLHSGLWATLRTVSRTENTPPLWYVLAWADSRVLGTGEVALRLPSALAGIACIPVAWGIGRELSGRRTGLVCAAFVALNPLFVWYSQEARAYGLFVLTAAVALLCFLRAEREPTRGRMAAFALAGSLALLTHYFAVFLLIPMVVWLLWEQRTRRAALPVLAAFVVVGGALLPLIAAQQSGGGTGWIGEWPLSQRLQAIPQYYLTGYSGKPLGRGVELLVALPILAGLGFGCWRMREHPRPREARRLLLVAAIAACGILIPIVLVLAGEDYLAPRNLVGAMIPLTAVIAVVTVWPGTGRAGIALAALICLGFLAVTLDVNKDVRLQRGNWRDLAKTLETGTDERAITSVDLGTAPLQYYLPKLHLHALRRGHSVIVSEIDEVGYEPLRASAGQPPVPGFHLVGHTEVDGLFAFRFVSAVGRLVSESTLRRHVITAERHAEVLVPAALNVSG